MFVTASFDGRIRLWDISSKLCRRTFTLKTNDTDDLNSDMDSDTEDHSHHYPVLKSKFDRIFTTCKGSNIAELNADLNTVQWFQGFGEGDPVAIDVSSNHIAVAYACRRNKILVSVMGRNSDQLDDQYNEVSQD